jgi:O-antigen/teichoic acid export membrane protein
VATLTAAGVSVAIGSWLIPRHGLIGAGLTLLVSYATQAIVAFVLAQRVYHVAYEYGRLVRILLSGIAAALAALALPPMPAWLGLLARGSTTVVVFAGCLFATGFFRASERDFLREIWTRARQRRRSTSRHGD